MEGTICKNNPNNECAPRYGAGYLIKHHDRFSPFIMAEEDAAAGPSSAADLKVAALLNGTQGDAGECTAGTSRPGLAPHWLMFSIEYWLRGCCIASFACT